MPAGTSKPACAIPGLKAAAVNGCGLPVRQCRYRQCRCKCSQHHAWQWRRQGTETASRAKATHQESARLAARGPKLPLPPTTSRATIGATIRWGGPSARVERRARSGVAAFCRPNGRLERQQRAPAFLLTARFPWRWSGTQPLSRQAKAYRNA